MTPLFNSIFKSFLRAERISNKFDWRGYECHYGKYSFAIYDDARLVGILLRDGWDVEPSPDEVMKLMLVI